MKRSALGVRQIFLIAAAKSTRVIELGNGSMNRVSFPYSGGTTLKLV
jgi:hypothetical protein